jgi:hypothetical protein
VVLLLVLLALLVLAGFGIRRLRRTRAIRSARRRQEQAAQEAVRLAAAAAERRESELRAHRSRVLAYERADREWCEREGALVELYEEAQHYTGREPAAFQWGRLRRGERVLIVADGALIEERSRQNAQHLAEEGTGMVVVTSHRLIFAGATKREWDYDKFVGEQQVGPGTTIIKVANRQRRSGVRFTEEVERARLMLDLALADARGSRSSVERRVRDDLTRHRACRPGRPALLAPDAG